MPCKKKSERRINTRKRNATKITISMIQLPITPRTLTRQKRKCYFRITLAHTYAYILYNNTINFHSYVRLHTFSVNVKSSFKISQELHVKEICISEIRIKTK